MAPDCNGDIFACYFHPISTCTVEPYDVTANRQKGSQSTSAAAHGRADLTGTTAGPFMLISDLIDIPEIPTDDEWIWGE